MSDPNDATISTEPTSEAPPMDTAAQPVTWRPTRQDDPASGPVAPVTGSLEVIHPDGTSEGLTVRAATHDDVPVLLRAIFGLTQAPEAATAPKNAGAAWQTANQDGDAVKVILWPEAKFDFTNNGLPREGTS